MYPKLLCGNLAARINAPHEVYRRLTGLRPPVAHYLLKLKANIHIAAKVNIAREGVLNVRNAVYAVVAGLREQLSKPSRQVLPSVSRYDSGRVINNEVTVM